MERLRVVIIGGVAAGPKTAATLARRLPEAKITLFQKEENISYGTCGLPYFASGDINSFEELAMTSYGVQRDVEFFKRSKGFDVFSGCEVIRIDRGKKEVHARNVKSDKIDIHGYDKLVIAVGATPVSPPFSVPDSPDIRSFTRPEDAIHFRRMAEQGKIDKVVIVGGGFIGCEMAEAVATMWGIEATLIEKEKQLLPYVLDPEMAHLVELEIKKQGIGLVIGHGVESITTDAEGVLTVNIENGEKARADYVFLCLGVRPETKLAADCGLEIGKTGAIAVNQTLQTSDPDIYAGGDCIESTHQITGTRIYMPMGSLANRHGRVIAENISGGSVYFPGVLGAFLVKVFDTNVGTVGLSERAAKSAGLDFRSAWAVFPDKPDYYPEFKTFTLKMVYERGIGRLLGLQAVGAGDICRRIDTFSSFLQRKATINDLLDFEHGYAPPYSEALDPLHHMAAIARAQEKGISFIKPGSAPEGKLTWLDVREAEEIEAQPWPFISKEGSNKLVCIPLNDLKERIDELEPSNRTIIICRRGPRSYQAALILKNAGFSDVHISAGGAQAVLT